jgi:succinoglycan biosynthesis transport protein ExoP
MSTLLDLMQPALEPEIFEAPVAEPKTAASPGCAPSNHAGFADEQMRLLVRQIFFPGWQKPPRHVAFSAVDESTYVAEICMEVGRILSAQVSGNVCLIEANAHNPELENVFGWRDRTVVPRDRFGSLRNSSQHVSGKLWLAPLRVLMGDGASPASAAWLERRLLDFRLEFDCTILHAPAVGPYSEAALLGHLSDGVALVLEANVTRRAAAQRAKEMLQAANARVLGMVLSERTFPIPEGIYKRL